MIAAYIVLSLSIGSAYHCIDRTVSPKAFYSLTHTIQVKPTDSIYLDVEVSFACNEINASLEFENFPVMNCTYEKIATFIDFKSNISAYYDIYQDQIIDNFINFSLFPKNISSNTDIVHSELVISLSIESYKFSGTKCDSLDSCPMSCKGKKVQPTPTKVKKTDKINFVIDFDTNPGHKTTDKDREKTNWVGVLIYIIIALVVVALVIVIVIVVYKRLKKSRQRSSLMPLAVEGTL